MKKIWLNNYPEGAPHTIDESKVPLHTFLDSSAKRYPDNTAIVFFGKRLSFAELLQLVNNFAYSLHKLGIRKGDRVAIFLPNCPQTIIAYYAVLKLGAVAVLINPLYVERELEYQINDSGAETLIFLDLLSKKVKNILAGVSLNRFIVTSIKDFLSFPKNLLFDIKHMFSGQQKIDIDGAYKFNELLMDNGDLPQIDITPEEDIALLQYTGGTTGLSKGVMLTHYNLVSNVLQARCWFSKVEIGKEILLAVPPFFHVFGMTVCMNFPIFIGSTIIVVPKFKVQDILKLMDKYKPTIFPGVPTMYVAINNYSGVKRYDLSSIKFCISGAAPLPVEVSKRFEEITGGKLVEGYGLTEASPITHCNPLFSMKKEGSIGLPLPSTDCKIVDIKKKNKELAIGEIGEMVIKGPQVMNGYWNKPDENKDVLQDGWLYTGDMAKADEDGYFYIVDRKKDIIISGGFNIYPREVEEVLYQHPKIAEAVVIGIHDEYFGEAVKAYVVLKIGYMSSESEIREFCKQRMAKYKIPKSIEFRKELPKNLIGKILRRVIREEESNKS